MFGKQKYAFRLFASLVITYLFISSCTIESSNNGHLDGFWHLEQIDTLATGGTYNTSDQLLFWAVQAKLLHLQGGSNGEFYLRFSHTENQFKTHSPHHDNWHQDNGENGGNPIVTDASLMADYGINSLEETFTVEYLSSKRMTLNNGVIRLEFKKF